MKYCSKRCAYKSGYIEINGEYKPVINGLKKYCLTTKSYINKKLAEILDSGQNISDDLSVVPRTYENSIPNIEIIQSLVLTKKEQDIANVFYNTLRRRNLSREDKIKLAYQKVKEIVEVN